MNEKITYPTFGSQSLGDIMHEIQGFPMTLHARISLAQNLMREFKQKNFRITFDLETGKIENFKLVSEDE